MDVSTQSYVQKREKLPHKKTTKQTMRLRRKTSSFLSFLFLKGRDHSSLQWITDGPNWSEGDVKVPFAKPTYFFTKEEQILRKNFMKGNCAFLKIVLQNLENTKIKKCECFLLTRIYIPLHAAINQK